MGKKQKNVPGQQPAEPSQPGQIMQDDGSNEMGESFADIEPGGVESPADINQN